MKISFYNGVSGLLAYQEDMDRISNNISNSGTVGFKASRTNFSQLLYTQMAVNSANQPLTGHGVKADDSRLQCKQGNVLQTGMPLDYAVMGAGFFAVERPDGSVQYTRSGAFDISVSGNKGYLVTADGSFVLDGKGKKIELERKAKDDPFDFTKLPDQIGIYMIENPYGLQPVGDTCYALTPSAGEAKADRNGASKLLQGALEQSSVDLSEEMVNVIQSQRAFQMNAKMVQTADELEQVINNLR